MEKSLEQGEQSLQAIASWSRINYSLLRGVRRWFSYIKLTPNVSCSSPTFYLAGLLQRDPGEYPNLCVEFDTAQIRIKSSCVHVLPSALCVKRPTPMRVDGLNGKFYDLDQLMRSWGVCSRYVYMIRFYY